MNNYNKLLNNLEKLQLTKTKDPLDSYLNLINEKNRCCISII